MQKNNPKGIPDHIRMLVRAQVDHEGRCLGCGQHVTIYTYTLDDSDVSALLKMWQYVIEHKENKIDMREVNLNYTERSRTTQLRFHNLITKYKTDDGQHEKSTWLITKRGGEFLRGEEAIPKTTYTYDNHVLGHGPELISRRDFRILDDFSAHYQQYKIEDGKVIEAYKTIRPLISACCREKIVDKKCTKCGRVAFGISV
jgi:hypothetical protein